MACEICRSHACTRSFHSFEDQAAFDERQEMSDDVDELRREIQDLKQENEKLNNTIDSLSP